ncbi:MAG: hypothetical protein HZA89_05020, partial [Verrucomicrobia bacterium]|nr:hypothetical protein [Verrucomicrobiota bacterium]
MKTKIFLSALDTIRVAARRAVRGFGLTVTVAFVLAAATYRAAAANAAPTLDPIIDLTINEDAGLQTVNLSGIDIGAGDSGQILTVTASSSDTGLVPTPGVTYTSPDATGSINFTPVGNANGTVTITVVVQDDGGTGGGGVDAVTNTFSVVVTAVNDAPTLAAIADPSAILEDAGLQTVNLSGIGSGAANETQTLTVTASSSNTGLIPTPTVSYTSANATGSISYTPVGNANGTATVTVIVSDDGGTSNGGVDAVTNTFSVVVTAVNDAPTLAAIADPTAILEDAGLQTVNLSGIGSGAANETQTLTVTASSSNTGLIPTPTVSYTSANATGSISYTPVGNANGTA